MSQFFCVFIPSKILQIEKHFTNKLDQWMTININENFTKFYCLSDLEHFAKRSDINLKITNLLYNRYQVIDFSFYFPEPELIKSLLSWLGNIYSYGDVGLLKYWSDSKKLYPPITIDENEQIIQDLSINNLTLDKIFFVSLKSYTNSLNVSDTSL